MAQRGDLLTTMEAYGDFKGADTIVFLNYPVDTFLVELSCRATLRERRFLFLWEPPTTAPTAYQPEKHQPFSKVFTWNDQLVDNSRYFKFHYPNLRTPMHAGQLPFNRRKLAVLIAGNRTSNHPQELYSARREVIDYFEKNHPGQFDLYGTNWSPKSYKNYKGSIKNKTDVLGAYKFCFCYENMRDVQGYVTEKIFDVFYCGCVPIYWGASNITDYIPSDCFIDRRRFKSNEELVHFLKNMTEVQYVEYIKAIRKFLHSEKSYPFSVENFCHQFMNTIT